MHGKSKLHGPACKPAIAQLVEHLTVEPCSNQMVPGSIPGGRTFPYLALRHRCVWPNDVAK